MSTRSNIIVQRVDGKWACIYCHWDGYIEHNGKILYESYKAQEKADALVALGSLSILDADPYDPPAGHVFDNATKGFCVAYGRDRGETGVEAEVGDTLESVWPAKDNAVEYVYVFAPTPGGPNDPMWYVGDPDLGPSSLVPLELALKDPSNYAPKPDIKSPFSGVLGHRDPTRA